MAQDRGYRLMDIDRCLQNNQFSIAEIIFILTIDNGTHYARLQASRQFSRDDANGNHSH